MGGVSKNLQFWLNGEKRTHTLSPKPLSNFPSGKEQCVKRAGPSETLLDYLRDQQGLTGCKLSCGIGECGSCMVEISPRPGESKYKYEI